MEETFVLYLSITLGPLVGLWVLSEWRDRKMRAPLPIRTLFRCVECFRFYESEEPINKHKCPVCGTQNKQLLI